MDFKKPNTHNNGRPKLVVPQRRGTPSNPSPVSQSPVNNSAPSHHAVTSAHAQQTHQPRTASEPSPRSDTSTKRKKRVTVSRIRQLLLTKKAIFASIAVVALVGSIAADAVIRHQSAAENAKNTDPNALIENLEYQTVIPEGKSISDLGGWKRVSPSKSDPVFAYTDSIDGIGISVSQQPLPKSFKGEAGDQLDDLAKKFNATTKIDSDGTTLYVGTSAKGPQSALLTKNNLLILIKSQSKISDKSWSEYAKSLN